MNNINKNNQFITGIVTDALLIELCKMIGRLRDLEPAFWIENSKQYIIILPEQIHQLLLMNKKKTGS